MAATSKENIHQNTTSIFLHLPVHFDFTLYWHSKTDIKKKCLTVFSPDLNTSNLSTQILAPWPVVNDCMLVSRDSCGARKHPQDCRLAELKDHTAQSGSTKPETALATGKRHSHTPGSNYVLPSLISSLFPPGESTTIQPHTGYANTREQET